MKYSLTATVRFEAATSGRSTFEILKEHVTFMPFMYAEGETKRENIPLVTYCLILTNVAVFYVFELNPFVDFQFIMDNLIFIPYKPNLWNIPLSAFASLFLHGSGGHLWGNMVFLWVVGTVVERRIGGRRVASRVSSTRKTPLSIFGNGHYTNTHLYWTKWGLRK